jgi:hypothetical protein
VVEVEIDDGGFVATLAHSEGESSKFTVDVD